MKQTKLAYSGAMSPLRDYWKQDMRKKARKARRRLKKRQGA